MELIDIPALLERLTLIEKVSLVTGVGWWHTRDLPGHNIPPVKLSDGPLGIRGSKNFGGCPANAIAGGIGLAASFDVAWAEEMGRFIGDEAKAKGVHVWLGPTINIIRSPLYGRAMENFSEDPLLSGKLGASMIKGAASKGIIATPKHFCCYEQNTDKSSHSAEVSERALREVYMRPFQIALKEADCRAIMMAYNRTNGIHCSENRFYMQDVLRDEWRWDGLIMSDWYGTYSTVESLTNGMDLEMPGPGVFRGEALTRSIKAKKVSEEILDRSVVNVLAMANQAITSGIPFDASEEFIDTPETRKLLHESACQATVLIKNEKHNLPLDKARTRKLAVIGPNAKEIHVCPGGSAKLKPLYTVTSYDGIARLAEEKGFEVNYAIGAPAFRYTPLVNRLCSSPVGKREKFEFEFFAEDPRNTAGAQAGYTMSVDTSEGFMYDEYDRAVVPRFCFMRLTTIFSPDETGEWEFGLSLVGLGKLFINGQQLIDNSNAEKQVKADLFYGEGSEEVKGRLHKGEKYRLCLDMNNFNLVDGAKELIGIAALQAFGAFRIGAIKALPSKEQMIQDAVDLASGSDAVIIIAGITGDYAEEGFDRKSMKLPEGVDDMIARVLKTNPNSTVVVQSGVPCEMPWRHEAASLIQQFYAGNAAGEGIASIIFGDHNPSSKLPITCPVSIEDSPSHPFFPGRSGFAIYNEDVLVGYRHPSLRNKEVIGRFGFGLSYTTFEIGQHERLSIQLSAKDKQLDVSMEVPVRNTGNRAGGEVVQAYMAAPTGQLPRVPLELAAFGKVFLEVGETKLVGLNMDRGCFSYWVPGICSEGYWKVDAGKYILHVGTSSVDFAYSVEVDILESFTWRVL